MEGEAERKRGRRRAPAAVKKTAAVRVNFTREQYEALKQLAEERGLSLGAYVRTLVLYALRRGG